MVCKITISELALDELQYTEEVICTCLSNLKGG